MAPCALASGGSRRFAFGDVAATGTAVRTDGTIVSRVVAGRIVEEWTVVDMLGLLRQLGAAPVESPQTR